MFKAHMLVLIEIETDSDEPFEIEGKYQSARCWDPDFVRLIGITRLKNSDGEIVWDDETYSDMGMQEIDP